MSGDGSRSESIRLYFLEQERRFLSGESPIPASAPPRPQTTTARPGYVDDHPVDLLFMSLASYRKGLSQEGVQYVRGREFNGGGDVYAAVVFGHDLAASSTPSGEEAARVSGRAILGLFP
jgi:hypothetical protein